MYTHRKQQEQGEGVAVPQITQKLKLTFPLLSVSLVGVSLMEYFGCAILGHSIYVGLTAGMIQIFFPPLSLTCQETVLICCTLHWPVLDHLTLRHGATPSIKSLGLSTGPSSGHVTQIICTSSKENHMEP